MCNGSHELAISDTRLVELIISWESLDETQRVAIAAIVSSHLHSAISPNSLVSRRYT
jgi:hypothetical protein